MSHLNAQTHHIKLSSAVMGLTWCWIHWCLKGMQIKMWIDFTILTLAGDCPAKPTMTDQELNFSLLWQWTEEMVSNKTVAATACTSEIAWDIKLDYTLVDFVHQAKASRKKRWNFLTEKLVRQTAVDKFTCWKGFLYTPHVFFKIVLRMEKVFKHPKPSHLFTVLP